uniref:Helicase POLQ-like n=1 Tax=Timema tahoe TaxID=61484 RepID=A0A7R9NWU2_9NEOP|nr:unnamed protein product [Timema tahoe]
MEEVLGACVVSRAGQCSSRQRHNPGGKKEKGESSQRILNNSTPIETNKLFTDFGGITPIKRKCSNTPVRCKREIVVGFSPGSTQTCMLALDESCLQAVDVEVVERNYWDCQNQQLGLDGAHQELGHHSEFLDLLNKESDFLLGEITSAALGENDSQGQSGAINLSHNISDVNYLPANNLSHGDGQNTANESNRQLIKCVGEIDVNWSDQSLLEEAIKLTNQMCQSSVPMGEKIKQALLNNAQRSVKSKPKTVSCVGPVGVTQEETGPFFGLPVEVQELIEQTKGITSLYTWQTECLELPALKHRKNVVLALPTSGGKTLVAEILVLKELLCQRRNALFVLPYVAIVQEKVRSLSPLAIALGFLVEEYAAGKGCYPPRRRRWKQTVYVATIEKAMGLVSSLVETDRLGEIGLAVVDELHLVGETGGRGANLEILLTKLLFYAVDLHVVGMSATIGNLGEVATFLLADSFCRNFRPVELQEYIKLEDQVFSINWDARCPEELLTLSRRIEPRIHDYVWSIVIVNLMVKVVSVVLASICEPGVLTFPPAGESAILIARTIEFRLTNLTEELSGRFSWTEFVGDQSKPLLYLWTGCALYGRDRFRDLMSGSRIGSLCELGGGQTNSDIDPDSIGSLVLEVVPEESVLVFCATKKNCENVALLVCQTMSRKFQEHKIDEKKALYRALMAECKGSVCPTLRNTLPFGVAYHHSGLMGGERRLLEEAFVSGTICCICCTSTLAAGVNLPAKRVILRSPYMGREFVSMSRYKQMVGRAGRAGMGSSLGESILVCKNTDIDKVRELVHSSMDQCVSSLAQGDASGMRSLLLSAIGQGMATSLADLHQLVKRTLLSVQATRLGVDLTALVDSTLVGLFREGALRVCNQQADVSVCLSGDNVSQTNKKLKLRRDTPLSVSRLGRAAIKGNNLLEQMLSPRLSTCDVAGTSVFQAVWTCDVVGTSVFQAVWTCDVVGCMDLKKARLLYEDLLQAQASLVLLTCLHLLYLVTPYDLVDQIRPSPSVYFNSYNNLSVQDQQCARVLGITEVCMVRIVKGHTHKGVPERVIKRFYLTLMLSELWQQESVWKVSVKYHVTRGFVQNLMSSSAAFAACVMRFCEELEEFWAFKDLLVNFSQRLSHCCTQELLPLMELPAVKRGRAQQLYNANFKTLKDIANTDVNTLVSCVDHISRKVAGQIIAAARLLLLEKVESLREEAQEVLEGIAVIPE